MLADLTCGKCGERITRMNMIRSIKETMSQYDSKCPSCGQTLSTSEFTFETES